MSGAHRNFGLGLLLGGFGFRQELALSKVRLADRELTGEYSASLDRDRFRSDVAFKATAFPDCDRPSGNNLGRHSALDVDVGDPHSPKTLNVGFTLDDYLLSPDSAWNFPDQIDRHQILAFKVAAQFSFDDGRVTDYARATEIALGGEVDVTAGPNGAAEAGDDLVITQIDMRAAAGAIGRCCLIADFMFAFALETGNEAIALPAPDCFQLSMQRHFFRSSG